LYQFNNGHKLRVDAMLIKPIQRLTRYRIYASFLLTLTFPLPQVPHVLQLSLQDLSGSWTA
jgi:hypothetical protein